TGISLDGDIDGIELVSRLRLDDDTKHKPIIVLTSSTWNTERQRAESAGCDLFLTKPCLPDELLREVHLLLASSKIGTRREKPAWMPIPGQGFVAWRHHPKHGSVAMIRVLMVGAAVAIAVTTASAQSTGRGSERKPAAAPRRTTSVRITVRDPGRATLAGVHL